MRIELLRDYLRHLAEEQDGEIGAASNDGQQWVSQHKGLPVDLHQLLQTSWPTAEMNAGPYTLHSVSDLSQNDNSEAVFKKGMFLFGSAPNGDLLVLKLTSKWSYECEVGLVSHEEFWSGNLLPDACYVPVCHDFDEFLYRAVEKKYLPMDYFCAIEHRKLKDRTEK